MLIFFHFIAPKAFIWHWHKSNWLSIKFLTLLSLIHLALSISQIGLVMLLLSLSLLSPTADNGTMQFWDWRSGYCFQKLQSLAQPGSLDSETGIFASSFDMSGCRLITGEADKTIKIYKEDETAVSISLVKYVCALF